MSEKSYRDYRRKRKEEHEKLCPKREIPLLLKQLWKKRSDIKNRKIAICLGCNEPNYQCKCQDHKTLHYSTMISNFSNQKIELQRP